jgi:hypothetical protein
LLGDNLFSHQVLALINELAIQSPAGKLTFLNFKYAPDRNIESR